MARYADALDATLGDSGRLISFSKSAYRERYPSSVVVFNASVCVTAGTIWHGDIDVSVDEFTLAALAGQIGETIFVLPEGPVDPQKLVDAAVFSVTPTGHTTFQHAYVERTKDGRLQRRPPEPDTRPRWTWNVVRHRPRLWRFWLIERRETENGAHEGHQHNRLVYIGARDGGTTPLLVLGLFVGGGLRKLGFELSWYPTHEPPRAAPRPLIFRQPTITIGHLTLWLAIVVWPGRTYELRVGYALKPGWR